MRCQYTMGKILHEGTYATIREAYHVDTGEAFACKIIEKRLLWGREYLVGNEIELLNRVSYAHPNIVTLHDYFESDNRLYLCFDLCTGGNLSQRLSSQGPYSEAGASYLIHALLSALRYIHSSGIVHGDLNPSNILFRSEEDDTEVMIADFGVSRLVGDMGNRSGHGTTTTTTMHERDAYVAPERFKQGCCTLNKPADIWSIGVLAYYMMIGHPPFHLSSPGNFELNRDDADDFLFDHVKGKNISGDARDFVEACLIMNPYRRPTVEQALRHKWLASAGNPYQWYSPSSTSTSTSSGDSLIYEFNNTVDTQNVHPGSSTETSPQTSLFRLIEGNAGFARTKLGVLSRIEEMEAE